jgi:fructose-1,6-bisphosphatase II
MEKLAVGPRAKGACDIRRSPTENLHALSEALGRPVRDLTAVILDRPRHEALIAEVRATGARIRSSPTGTWPGPSPPDGPAPAPTSSSASAARPRASWPRPPSSAWAGRSRDGSTPQRRERAAAIDAGYDLDAVLTTDDLVQGDNCFFAATGITDGELLQGVRTTSSGPPPSRWSCARSRGPCARSTPATRWPSCRSSARFHSFR